MHNPCKFHDPRASIKVISVKMSLDVTAKISLIRTVLKELAEIIKYRLDVGLLIPQRTCKKFLIIKKK